MKKAIVACLLAGMTLFPACESANDSNETTTVSGAVYTLQSDGDYIPVANALVTSQTVSVFAQTLTNSQGGYTLNLDIGEDESKQIELEISKVGFFNGTATVLAQKGSNAIVSDVTLARINADSGDGGGDLPTGSSGKAAHIVLENSPDPHIYVRSSGLQETTVLVFRVTDSEGRLVSDDNAVEVNFSIKNGPGGGEYVFPESMTTENGLCYTVLSSGTVSGAVQLEATFQNENGTFSAIPPRVAIFGGLPDEDHFSVAIERANIAGRVHFGILDNVTAFVGDQYSNPVAPGTIVYFSSDYGIVDGAAVTDEMGRATVSFMSAAPLPPDPINDPFATISAWTYGDTLTNLTLSAETTVLLSAATAPIGINPSTFTYDATNQPSNFSYSVNDIFGHPLVGNTTISVKATDGDLFGDTQVTLDDARFSGSGTTDFNFTWAPGDSLEAPQVYITIEVTTPSQGNGRASTSIAGMRDWTP